MVISVIVMEFMRMCGVLHHVVMVVNELYVVVTVVCVVAVVLVPVAADDWIKWCVWCCFVRRPIYYLARQVMALIVT